MSFSYDETNFGSRNRRQGAFESKEGESIGSSQKTVVSDLRSPNGRRHAQSPVADAEIGSADSLPHHDQGQLEHYADFLRSVDLEQSTNQTDD